MRMLVVGATGRTGREVVGLAAGAGHEVFAFARSAGDVVWPEGVHAVPGDVLDAAAVDAVMSQVEVVVVALSMVRASNSPWAPILTPLDLHTQAATLLLGTAERHGVERYVTISAQGVGDSARRAGWAFLALVRASNIGVGYAELERAEALVRASDRRWTIVRPTRLTMDAPTGRWREDPRLVTTSLDRIAREDLAAWLVEEATRDTPREGVVAVTSVR